MSILHRLSLPITLTVAHDMGSSSLRSHRTHSGGLAPSQYAFRSPQHTIKYGHALRSPQSLPNGLGRPPPPSCGVGSGGVDWESPSLLPPLCGVGSGGWESFLPCGVGFGGWESRSLLPPMLVLSLVRSTPCWEVWWGRIRGPSRVGSPGGREEH